MSGDDNGYRPLRLLRNHTVSGTDMVVLRKAFPNGQPLKVKGPDQFALRFHAGQVLNDPSDAEKEMLERNYGKGMTAVVIPQDPEGFDDPLSNLGRSRKGSAKGRRDYALAQAREEREMKVRQPDVEGGETN